MSTTNRYPRPIGTTHLAIQSHTHTTEESSNKLKNHLYQHYINTNYQYNGIPLTITQFTTLLSLDINELNNYIYHINKVQHKLLSEDGIQDLHGAILNLTMGAVLSDRSAAMQQLHILQKSQGDTYMPFVSAEVTKALTSTQNTTKAMLDLLKAIGGNQGLAININNHNGDQVQQNTLTVEMAQEMIEAQPSYIPLARDNKTLEALWLENDLEAMPEVNANKQIGMDVSREGLTFGVIQDANVEGNEALDHTDRRANQIGLDIEESI